MHLTLWQVNISVDKEKDDGPKLKEAMRIDGTPVIQMQLAKYIQQLKDGKFLNSVWIIISDHFQSRMFIKFKSLPVAIGEIRKKHWWPLQTFWIQMRPNKRWDFIWDPNCYIDTKILYKQNFGWKWWIFAYFEREKIRRKNTWHARHVKTGIQYWF